MSTNLSEHPGSSKLHRFMGVIRMVLAILVLVLVARQIADWGELQAALASTRPIFLAGCIAIYFVGVWISCVKWQHLLQTLDAKVALRTLIRWYLAGNFAGTFLPSDIGGDVVRGYIADRTLRNQVTVWSSIAAERLTGLVGLVLLAATTLMITPSLLGWNPLLLIAGLALLVAMMIGGAAVLLHAAPPPWAPAARALQRVRLVLAAYAGQPHVLIICLGYSLIYHLLTVVSLWLVLLALEPTTPFASAFVAPIVGLIGLLPLTPGGLGVREGALAVLLERAGVAGSVALAAALISRFLLWLVALSGLPGLIVEPGILMQARTHRRP